MRRRLPGHLASLATLLRSMPTAVGQGYQALARREADDLKNQVPTHFSSAELARTSIEDLRLSAQISPVLYLGAVLAQDSPCDVGWQDSRTRPLGMHAADAWALPSSSSHRASTWALA